MSVIYIVLPLALLLAAAAVVAFIWSVRSGQLDDLDTPALRVLHDQDEEKSNRGGIEETKKKTPGGCGRTPRPQ